MIGALTAGIILARRRMMERFTLISLECTCPKCDAPIKVKRTRLRIPHPLTCQACHHQASLKVPAETLVASMAA